MSARDQERIGLFGGSFDPIHFGHLKMAEDLLKAKNLHQIWFCPARLSPHKLDHIAPAPAEHRLKMLELALTDYPQFFISDLELSREGPSYTIDTINILLEKERKRNNPRQFYLIMSDEALPGFFNWKNPKEIISLIPLLVGSRKSSSPTPPPLKGDPQILQAIALGWTPTEKIDISSTEIRNRLKKGLDCDGLVPKKVLDYISQNKLYC